MKNDTKNPVISKDDAKLIDKTFASVQPVLHANILNRKDATARLAEIEASDKNSADKAKARYPLSKRLNDLDVIDANDGWFDFGTPTTGLKYTSLNNERGIQISMKNHRDETIKCNLNRLKEYNRNLPEYIETALQIAEATNQIAKFKTASFGAWSTGEWFATVAVTLVPRKESK